MESAVPDLGNVVSGSQIRQLGKDQEPIDLSSKENFELFQKDMGTWGKKMATDNERVHFGYVDLDSATPVPYGAAA